MGECYVVISCNRLQVISASFTHFSLVMCSSELIDIFLTSMWFVSYLYETGKHTIITCFLEAVLHGVVFRITLEDEDDDNSICIAS